MVIDTSAIIALVGKEADAGAFEALIAAAPECRISAFNAFETRVVLWRRYGDAAVVAFDVLLRDAGIAVSPFDHDQAATALDAYRRFGKGTGHPAQLNVGDCAAYALAVSLGQPLLFKGDHFTRTDVRAAP
jgi:ribonuclease VapC